MKRNRTKFLIGILAACAVLGGFVPGAQARNCVGLGDRYYNDPSGKCYYAESTAVDQSVAQAACVANGGNLAAIGSAAEQSTLSSTFNGMGELFIGGSDADTEDYWVWGGGEQQGQVFWEGLAAGSSTRGLYTNWESTQPNNNTNADCLSFNTGASGQWYDVACTAGSMSGYLCELYACQNPLGDQGEVIFNQDARTLQYCNGGMWVPMAQPGYTPTAVVFDGTNDYMTSASAQAADTQRVTGSLWIKYNGAVNVPYTILSQNGTGIFQLRYTGGSGNRFDVIGRRTDGTIVYQVRCGSALPVVGQWHHIVFSADLSDINKRYCYVNDILAENYVAYTVGETMNVDTANARIGANNDGPATNKLNASIADLWVDFGTYIDLSVAGNRRKFIDAAGKPVYLSADGSGPTGVRPEIFLSGALGAWHTNKGTATGYTLSGALTADTAPGTLAGSDITSGLVGHWAFDDPSGSTTATNNVGGSPPGTLTGMTPASDWVTGKIGGGLDFDGSNDVVVVPANSTLNNMGTISICAWVYPRALVNDYGVIYDKSTNGGDGPNFYMYKPNSYNIGYQNRHFGYVDKTTGTVLNSWQHMCTTWDFTDGFGGISLYRNGVLLSVNGASGDGPGLSDDSVFNINIGGHSLAGTLFFNGILDDLRVYNRVLSAGEILSLYEWGNAAGNYCTNPSRSPGTIIYNDVSNVPQFCDGGTWRALGPFPGPGGAGCSNPARGEGHILFNSATRTMQYCNGVAWRSMPGMTIGAPTAGLVNHWPMEDGAASMTIDDVVGTNDCTVTVNGGTRTSVTGMVGNALRYQQSYAVCGVIAAMHDVTQFTLSAWLKRTSAGDNVYVFEEGGGTSQMGIDFYGNGETYFTLTNPPSSGYEEGNFPLNDTNWHLITMVYNGSLTGDSNRLKGYIDGQQVTLNFNGSGIIDAVTGPYATAAPLRLYNLVGTANGSIDDIRIYNRALSAAEVSQLYYGTGGQ